MAGIRITLLETGQESVARLSVIGSSPARFDIPKSLRFLRLCYRNKIDIKIQENSK